VSAPGANPARLRQSGWRRCPGFTTRDRPGGARTLSSLLAAAHWIGPAWFTLAGFGRSTRAGRGTWGGESGGLWAHSSSASAGWRPIRGFSSENRGAAGTGPADKKWGGLGRCSSNCRSPVCHQLHSAGCGWGGVVNFVRQGRLYVNWVGLMGFDAEPLRGLGASGAGMK